MAYVDGLLRGLERTRRGKKATKAKYRSRLTTKGKGFPQSRQKYTLHATGPFDPKPVCLTNRIRSQPRLTQVLGIRAKMAGDQVDVHLRRKQRRTTG